MNYKIENYDKILKINKMLRRGDVKVKKRILTLGLLILLLSMSLVTIVSAKDNGEKKISINEPIEISYVNPLYADVVQPSDLNESKDISDKSISIQANGQYYETYAEAGIVARQGMKKRQETIEVGFQAPEYDSTMAKRIMESAMLHTGVPTEGDYLRWQYAGWKCQISYYKVDGLCYFTFTYTMTYYTTAEQEAMVDSAVSSLINQLNLDSQDDYHKVKEVYDYMCENITYDYANLNDDSYYLKYTAYAALVDRTSVCQGYSVLFCRLMLELDVDVRLISGYGAGGGHAWNIVELEKNYYNVDATWDAGSENYHYFLKTNDNFGDHTRDTEYETEDFKNSYPIGVSDYVYIPKEEVKIHLQI